MIRFKTLSLLIVLATLGVACERESIVPATSDAPQLYGTSGLVPPAVQCGSSAFSFITDAQGNNLGNVEIANDAANVYVMISMHVTRFLEDLRLFVGEASTIDVDGTGTPIMEGFQFQSVFSTPQGRYTVILPKSTLGACTDIVLYGRAATRNQFGQMSGRRFIWIDGLPLHNIEAYKYCFGSCAVSGGGGGSIH
jgi:hypothetical protein